MSNGLLGVAQIKRKIFVSYHHGGDQAYYDAFSRSFCDTYDVVTDNSLQRAIDSDDPDYVMRRIRENFIHGSSCTVLLVGAQTHLRKHVDWEIKATLDKQHGLIGVSLPTLPVNAQGKVNVPGRLNDNISSGFALWLPWSQITASTFNCQQAIEAANARSKSLIVNTRERRLRNG